MTSTTDELVLAGRFQCQRLLKSGLGVNTYAGVDLNDGGAVIVKTVDASAVSSAVSLRVAHEAVILRRLERPDFKPLVAVGRDEDILYLVQPYVPGMTLQARLEASGPLSVDSALRVAIDVLRSLEHAHDGDVLHRDVKPANVIVGPGEPIERAVLIDFGFARSAWLDPTIRDEPVGTLRYLAPEATGALGATLVDERSDLYSVGVLLFECLVGRPPFDGKDVGEIIRHHLNTPAPALGSLRADVPRAVEGAVQRLLRKDPDHRYQSAAAVLADLEAVAAARSRGFSDPPVIVGLSDRRQALTEPSFVGRTAELAVLSGLVDQARLGSGRLVLVEADSGGGKTRLLDELVRRAGPGIWVLRGQGVDQAARRPFQVLEGVAAGIVAAAQERPELVQMLRVRLGDSGNAAAAALPALAPLIAADGPVDVGPEAYGQIRSVNALAALLDALGDCNSVVGTQPDSVVGTQPDSVVGTQPDSVVGTQPDSVAGAQPAHPVVVVLDDCQWADELSVRLLASWAENAASSTGHVLVLAAFRSEEVGPDSPLRTIPNALHVELGPFDTADVRSLAESMAGPLPHEAVEVVAQLAEGSPFMAAAVLRGLVESGALVNSNDGWRVDSTLLASAQTSRRAALFLLRRLELLSPSALSLLSVGAVLGKEFDLGLAVELTGQDSEAVAAGLRDAQRRRIVWVDEKTGHCSFRHDKIREALLDRLDEATRRTLHLRAAHRIEATDRDRCFELAYHFDAGGRTDRALPYALEAAESARRRNALEVAVDHYRIAERAAVTDSATRAQVAEGLGDVLTLEGRYEEAAKYLERAKSLVKWGARSAEIEGKLGDVAFKRGNHIEARAHLEGALRQLRRRVPRRMPGFLVLLLKELVIQIAHTAAPRLFTGRRPLEGSENEFLALRIYSRLAYVYWFHAGKIACGWAHLREMNLAERYPPTEALAQAYSEHAPVATMIPWYSRGIAYARRSLAIRRELGNVWGEGQSLGFYGAVLYSASRYQECIDCCEEAARLLDRTGDRWEANTARWHTAFAYYRLGELPRAVDLAKALYASATSIGDKTSAGVALSVWSRASCGRVPAEYLAEALAEGTQDAHTGTEVRVAEGVRLLAVGDVEAAISLFHEAYGVVRHAGLRQEYVAPVLPWLSTALRVRAEQLPAFRSLRHRAQLRRAAEVARRAAMTARDYQNNRPHALREQALVAAMRGRGRRSRRLFAGSLAIADRQGAAYEYALTQAAYGRVGESMGWPGAAEIRAQAEVDLRTLRADDRSPDATAGESASLSLADRFDSLLEVGRTIASAPSARSIYAAVVDAALTLLRGERCEITAVGEVGVDDIAAGVLVSETSDDPVSRTLVRRALETGGPVVSGEQMGGGAEDSVVLLGLRSVLCAPIYCADQPVACFSVVHHDLGDLFSDDEIRLAEFIATLAGAALEALAGTEARFRSLAKNSSDVITIVDRDGIVVYSSSSVQRVFGLSPHEVVGRAFAELVHPEDAERVADALAAAGAGEVLPLLECRLAHADGDWRHVETALNDMFDDPVVRGLVLNSRDISERKSLEDELRRRALHDDLTGLANRGLFAERLEHRLATCSGGSLAVLFLDLDDFKGINDSLGHAAGDQLLKDVARRLLTCVRPQDTVARLGGDEFAIMLEGADEVRARKVADRVLAAMAPSFEVDGQSLNAHTSVGVAVAAGGNADAGELLSRADAAMYVAKSLGKGRYELFEPSMRVAALERVTIKNDLQWAVQCDEMDTYYQPLIDLKSGGVVGFEAMLRWRHPVRGLLSPAEFMDVAEESGLIVPIGAWTLRQACREGRRLQRSHPERPPFGMSVNVSTRQLQHPRLVQDVEVALAESNFDPTLLTLEITESATVHDTEATIRKLEELKALGLRLAIDDFGTGYSSLSYLRRFPVDQLKIDRSFVAGLGHDAQDTAIVTSVVSLAHALGLEAVGEGVETMEQLEALATLGCDLAQGFNWRRPGAFDDVDAWLTPSATFLGLGTDGSRNGRRQSAVVRTLLVDDRDQVRAAIRLAMELDGHFTVVGEASDGQEAIAAAARHQPDLVVLDLMMPGMGGVQAIGAIRDAAPGASIVLLTSADQADIPETELRQTLGLIDKTLDLDALVRRLSGLLQLVA